MDEASWVKKKSYKFHHHASLSAVGVNRAEQPSLLTMDLLIPRPSSYCVSSLFEDVYLMLIKAKFESKNFIGLSSIIIANKSGCWWITSKQ